MIWRIKTELISKSSNSFSTSINVEKTLAEPQIVYDVLPNTANQQKAYISSDESASDVERIEFPNIVMRQIKERRGQQKFRQELRRKHNDKCMLTGCDIPDILEAAHIYSKRLISGLLKKRLKSITDSAFGHFQKVKFQPVQSISSYSGDNNNHITNGLLLRADIHTLFDLDLLGIEPNNLTIHLHPSAKKDDYAQYQGKHLSCDIPLNRQALESRWQSFQSRLRN